MIKLSFRFDVSLSKVIFGVAGISATICAFQYFTSKNSELKSSTKNDVVQYKSDSKKENKLSNLVSATPTVKRSKDKSARDDFKNNKADNELDEFPNEIKGNISLSKHLLRKRSDCTDQYNSNYQRYISKTDISCKGPASENKSNKTNIKEESQGRVKDQIIKVPEKQVEIGTRTSTSTSLEKLSITIDETQNKIMDKNMLNFDKRTDSNFEGSNSKTYCDIRNNNEKTIVDIEKEPEKNNKVEKLRNDLNQQHRFFTIVLKIINDEQKKHVNNIDQLEKGVLVSQLYEKTSSRLDKIIEDLNKQKCNELLKQLLRNVFSLQIKVWKKASNCLIHKSKLSAKKNENLKDLFDYIKAILDMIKDLFKIILKTINLKVMYMNETDKNKKNNYIKLLNELLVNSNESKRKLLNTFEDLANENNSLEEDLNNLVESLSVLFLNFYDICSNFKKNLAEY